MVMTPKSDIELFFMSISKKNHNMKLVVVSPARVEPSTTGEITERSIDRND